MIKQNTEIIFNPELVTAKALAGKSPAGEPVFGVALNNSITSVEFTGDIKIIFPSNKAFESFVAKAIEGRMAANPEPVAIQEQGEVVDADYIETAPTPIKKGKKKNGKV